jgi:hypothetical protein
MMRKIHLIAASLIGLTLPVLSPAPTHALPGSGAFAPAVDTALVPVADLGVVPTERQRWRYGHRRSARVWRPSRPYYAPYADYPAYRYGGYVAYECCEVYAVYPAYERPYSYSHMGRYYYAEGPRYYLPGFHGPASYYYW